MTNYLLGKTFSVHTLGCKVNTCESEAIRMMLTDCGCKEVSFGEICDITIVNTCTVTNIADRKTRQMLHKARAVSEHAVIVAVGCYVQKSGIAETDIPADVCIGNRRKGEIVHVLNDVYRRMEAGESAPFSYLEDAPRSEYEDLPPTVSQERTRAFLKIQDGCNQFCSYCIIPYVRGRIASRAPEQVVKEATVLAGNGVHEIVLNGIHLSSYGLENHSAREIAELKPISGELPLLTLLRKVAGIPGIERIRLGSLEPRIMTEDFIRGLSEIPSLCPQFHLSLQSGCDRTLAAMRRHYTTEQYKEAVRLLRTYFDDPAITTDVIAGFPGETEGDFSESLAFIGEIGFAQVHVFPYSRRSGTLADRMDGHLTENCKKERAGRLIAAAERESVAYRTRWIGKEARVLLEEPAPEYGDGFYRGYSREYIPYVVSANADAVNREMTVIGSKILPDRSVLVK